MLEFWDGSGIPVLDRVPQDQIFFCFSYMNLMQISIQYFDFTRNSKTNGIVYMLAVQFIYEPFHDKMCLKHMQTVKVRSACASIQSNQCRS